MANHMEELANMLGVELNERFGVCSTCSTDYIDPYEYYLTVDGLNVVDSNGNVFPVDSISTKLFTGEVAVKRKPWRPKGGEAYWSVYMDGTIRIDEWWDSDFPDINDINNYKLGNCYRTPEEAEDNKDKWIKFYTSYDVLEV